MKTRVESLAGTSIVNNVRVNGLTTNSLSWNKCKHFISWDDLKGETKEDKRKAYEALITSPNNHPEYDYISQDEDLQTIIITTPSVPQAEHPYKEELANAFETEELPPFASNVDEQTGEITEPQQKQDPIMETRTNEPVVETQPKVSIAKKSKWYGAVALGLMVRTVTVPTHFTLQAGADVLQASANAVRNTEAVCIDKLKLSTATRVQIKESINMRTARMERICLMPITIPVGIVAGIRESIKNPVVAPQVQTA